jgi:hypothetical protein
LPNFSFIWVYYFDRKLYLIALIHFSNFVFSCDIPHEVVLLCKKPVRGTKTLVLQRWTLCVLMLQVALQHCKACVKNTNLACTFAQSICKLANLVVLSFPRFQRVTVHMSKPRSHSSPVSITVPQLFDTGALAGQTGLLVQALAIPCRQRTMQSVTGPRQKPTPGVLTILRSMQKIVMNRAATVQWRMRLQRWAFAHCKA